MGFFKKIGRFVTKNLKSAPKTLGAFVDVASRGAQTYASIKSGGKIPPAQVQQQQLPTNNFPTFPNFGNTSFTPVQTPLPPTQEKLKPFSSAWFKKYTTQIALSTILVVGAIISIILLRKPKTKKRYAR